MGPRERSRHQHRAARAVGLVTLCGAVFVVVASSDCRPARTADDLVSLDAGPPAEAAPRDDGWPSLADLAGSAPRYAPGLRESARRELVIGANAPFEIARAADADVCLRAAIATKSATHLQLEVEPGVAYDDGAELHPLDPVHVVGSKGPLCLRRGDTLRARLEPSVETAVRLVVWTSR